MNQGKWGCEPVAHEPDCLSANRIEAPWLGGGAWPRNHALDTLATSAAVSAARGNRTPRSGDPAGSQEIAWNRRRRVASLRARGLPLRNLHANRGISMFWISWWP